MLAKKRIYNYDLEQCNQSPTIVLQTALNIDFAGASINI